MRRLAFLFVAASLLLLFPVPCRATDFSEEFELYRSAVPDDITNDLPPGLLSQDPNESGDAVRRSLPVKKVTSNHKKQETVILTEQDIEDSLLTAAIKDSGYTPMGITREVEQPHSLKALFKK